MAELAQRPDRGVGGRTCLRMGIGRDLGRNAHPDGETSRVSADLSSQRPSGHRRLKRAGQLAARQDVEHRRGIPDGTGDDALHGRAMHHLRVGGPHREQTTPGLETHQPTARCGDPRGTTTVVCAGHGDDPRSDGRRRPARRATGCAVKCPRVAGGPEQIRFGDALGAELRAIGLAEDDQSSLKPSLDDGRVLGAPAASPARGCRHWSARRRSPERDP